MVNALRIGIFTDAYPGFTGSGGIATYTRALTLGLTRLGHEVHLLISVSDGEQESIDLDGARAHLLPITYLPGAERLWPGAWQSAVVSAYARRLTHRHQLDIFEFPNWEGRGAFYNLVKWGTPMVVRINTSLRETIEVEGTSLGRKEKFEVDLENRTCLTADAIYVSTRAHRSAIATELGVSESRMSVVPLGLPDASMVVREPRPRNPAPIVLFLGRLETRKGVTELLEAARIVVSEIPNVRFVLIGRDRPHAPGGITHQQWLRDGFSPEVAGQVEFLGVQNDAAVEDWFRRADLFVAPSRYESFGLVFVEAMRAAVPVIGTTAGGIPEVVTPGRSGLLVEPQQPGQIAEAILTLLRDEPRRIALARGARAEYEARFSNTTMARHTIEHHRALLQRLPNRVRSR
jgi:glycosyltransferase involved in cell wall biosynthesis